jgi:hypothetical protein
VELEPAGLTGDNRVPGMVDRTVFQGSTTRVMVRLPHGPVIQALLTNVTTADRYRAGEPVTVHLPPDSFRVLDASHGASPVAIAR